MQTINIHKAKTNLSKLIENVQNGEEVVISKAGTPVVKMILFKKAAKKRPIGLLKGKIKIAKDFDKLPKETLKSFYK